MSETVQDLLARARQLDPDRALALAFAAPEDRPQLAALVLLNAELARIPEVVREPMAGLIRYQWWRDALARAARGEGGGQHPLLPPLVAGLAAGRMDLAALVALIDAREWELDRLPPADLAALDAYAGATSGALHRLMAAVCGGEGRTLEAAGRVGSGFALVGILRAIGFHRAQGRVLLPADLLARDAVDTAEILAARNEAALARVADEVLALARGHLAAAAAAGPFARRVLPALLPGHLAARQARRLASLGPLAAGAPSRDAWTVPALLWRWLVRRL